MSKFLKQFNNKMKTMERYKKKKFQLKLKVDAQQFVETLLGAFTLQITDDNGIVQQMQVNDDANMIRKVLEQIDCRHQINQLRANRAIFPYLDSLHEQVNALFTVIEKKPDNPFRKSVMEQFCSSVNGVNVKTKIWKDVQKVLNNQKYIQIEYSVAASSGKEIKELVQKFEDKFEEHKITLIKGKLSHNSQNLFI